MSGLCFFAFTRAWDQPSRLDLITIIERKWLQQRQIIGLVVNDQTQDSMVFVHVLLKHVSANLRIRLNGTTFI
jgi:hypothetical protein